MVVWIKWQVARVMIALGCIAAATKTFTTQAMILCQHAVIVRLSIHPSVINRYGIEMTGWIQLYIGTQASFHLSYTVLQGNLGISTNKGTSLWNFIPNSDLTKNFLPWQFDHVVNKSHWRSSLLTTLTTVTTLWMNVHCLLHVRRM